MPLHLITYDIAHPRRLRRVARVCERHGTRVQESVFVVDLEPAELIRLIAALARILNFAEDSVRYTPVCAEDLRGGSGLGLCSGLKPVPAAWVV
jgi:CRISPR-associated protein Cas2